MEKYNFEQAKKEYREFCIENTSVGIFLQPWYLDAACIDKGDNWEVILIKNDGKIIAAFPFGYKKQKGFRYIYNPFQVCRLDIWIDYGNRESKYKKFSYYEEIVKKVVELLPPYDRFQIAFSYKMKNWMPFYQLGFTQTTRYSQVIYPEKQEVIWNNLQKYRRKEIKNAIGTYTVKEINSSDVFYIFFEQYYKKKGEDVSFSRIQFEALYQAAKKNNAVIVTGAYSENGTLVAELFTIYDKERSYTLFVAFDNDSAGARAFLDWYGICKFVNQEITYDFEGSMISGVAEYNRRYNAEMEPYFVISKESRRYKILIKIKELLKLI